MSPRARSCRLTSQQVLMRSVVLMALVIGALASPAARQTTAPAFEISAGYSYLPADREDDFPRRNSHGFQFGAAVHVNDWFAIAGEMAMQFNTARDLGPDFSGMVARTRVIEYLVGPRFTARSETVSLFVHGLVGLASGDAGEAFSGFSDTKPAFGGGIGVDVALRDRVALRGQFDLLGSFADIVEGNTRAGLAIVLGLGGR